MRVQMPFGEQFGDCDRMPRYTDHRFCGIARRGGLAELIGFFNQRDIVWLEVGDVFGEFRLSA